MKTLPLYKSDEGRRMVLELHDTVLSHWPLPLERIRMKTGAGETAVFAFGPSAGKAGKPPLILLHGTLSNSSMWMGDAAVLVRGRWVYAVDIPGEPGMSAETRLDWQGEGSAIWLAEVRSALGLGEHQILGCSIGGWIGLTYAAGNPVGLSALAMLCPSGIGKTRKSFIFKAMIAMARGKPGLESLSRSLYGDFDPPPEALRYGSMLSEATNARMEEPRLLSDDEIARIGAGLFLACGAKDVLLHSGESAARLKRLQPRSEIHLVPGAGHVLMGLGERIAAFLDSHGEEGAIPD
jgi:pimeloyl-ACP methyl ester carboxylesterase